MLRQRCTRHVCDLTGLCTGHCLAKSWALPRLYYNQVSDLTTLMVAT